MISVEYAEGEKNRLDIVCTGINALFSSDAIFDRSICNVN